MTSFDDILKQVNLTSDFILSDILTDTTTQAAETVIFSKHIIKTKCWFSRISCKNKKMFIISLMDYVKTIWAVCLILKSIWNCRTKDIVLTVSEFRTMATYDRPPMDHDRTAKPEAALQELMCDERRYFNSLKSDRQALFLLELLSISGGPVLCDVLKYCQDMYENYLNVRTSTLQDTIVITEPLPMKIVPDALESQLAAWSMKIKAMRDTGKLEEVEQTFEDGSKSRMWRVNRMKPEAPETLDLIQLLPSAISKRIFMYLPLPQLSDCAKVNKYWAYIIDEIRLEIVARQKINLELEKMRDNIIRQDEGLDLFNQLELPPARPCAKTTRNFISKRDKYTGLTRKKIKNPFANSNSINEQLNRRGAADEHVWKWCSNVMKFYKEINAEKSQEHEGLMKLGDTHFPCPTLGNCIMIPLDPPLTRDPIK